MATAIRIVIPSLRPGRPRVRMFAAVGGGLAGLVAGTVLAALAPGVDRAPAADPPPTSSRDDAPDRPRRDQAGRVAAALLPAIEAGVRSSLVDDHEGDGP